MSSTTENKTILIFGATGDQGGAIVDALLDKSDKSWYIRASTRNVNSEKAQALAQKLGSRGEVVAADQDDKDSIDKIMANVDSVFAITDWWAHADGEHEVQQAMSMIDYAKQHGVKQFVWSTLPDAKKGSNGQYVYVRHFDFKAYIDTLVAEAGFDYHTNVLVPLYYEDFVKFWPPKKQEDGTYVVSVPVSADVPLQQGSVRDVGPIVFEILSDPAKYQGRYVAYIGEEISMADCVRIISKRTGKDVRFEKADADEVKKGGVPMLAMVEMMQLMENYKGYITQVPTYGLEGIEKAKTEFPVQTFQQWVDGYEFQF